MKPMITAILVVFGMLFYYAPVNAKVSIKTIEKWQQKYAVVLAFKHKGEYRDYCSGTLTKKGIITAAHCCALPFIDPANRHYSKNGETYRSISSYTMDANGNDICMMQPSIKDPSPIKIADMPSLDPNTGTFMKDYYNISKISIIYGREDLKIREVQNIYFISLWDDEIRVALFRGYGMPGMSGSGIIDKKGNLVAVLTNGIYNDRGRMTGDKSDTIEGIFGAALIQNSEWGTRGAV